MSANTHSQDSIGHLSPGHCFGNAVSMSYAPARSSEREHQLEKLEFALAVAVTRGDSDRIQALRDQIAALGGNCEEPGT